MSLMLSDLIPLSVAVPKLLLDDEIVDAYTASAFAYVYWRWDDDPTMTFQYLGRQNAGSTLVVPFSNPPSRAIRLSVISSTEDGQLTATDPRLGEQTVYTPDPLLGIVTYGGDVVTYGGDVVVWGS